MTQLQERYQRPVYIPTAPMSTPPTYTPYTPSAPVATPAYTAPKSEPESPSFYQDLRHEVNSQPTPQKRTVFITRSSDAYEQEMANLVQTVEKMKKNIAMGFAASLLISLILLLTQINMSSSQPSYKDLTGEVLKKADKTLALIEERMGKWEKNLSHYISENSQARKEIRKLAGEMRNFQNKFNKIEETAGDFQKLDNRITNTYLRLQNVEQDFTRFRQYMTMKEKS